METQYDCLSDRHINFTGQQHLFFADTTGAEGKVNAARVGLGSLRVPGRNRIPACREDLTAQTLRGEQNGINEK